MKKKTAISIIAAVAAVLLLAGAAFGMWGLYKLNQEGIELGEKNVTVTVVHKNGDRRDFECQTWEVYLGKLLVKEGIVEDNQDQHGLYILVADGELADYSVDGGWWKIYRNGAEAMTGADQLPIRNGDKIEVVYTVGF